MHSCSLLKKLSALCLAILFSSAHLGATVLIDDHFATYEPGSEPDAPDDGNPNSWKFGESFEAKVKREDERNYVHLFREGGEAYSTISRRFEPSGGVLDLKLKFRRHSGNPSDYFVFLADSSQGNFSGPVKIRVTTDGALEFYGRNEERVTYPGKLSPEQWYILEVKVDFNSQQYQVSVGEDDLPESKFETKPIPFVAKADVCDLFLIRPSESSQLTRGSLDWDLAEVVLTGN